MDKEARPSGGRGALDLFPTEDLRKTRSRDLIPARF
jgi:hypothetical protein